MRTLATCRLRAVLPFVLAAALAIVGGRSVHAAPSLRFEIRLTEQAAQHIADLGLETPVTGRVYVIVSRDAEREPRRQIGVDGVPFWGMDVQGLAGGRTVTLAGGDDDVWGYPFAGLDELPPGDYAVQAFLNVYTTFHRADGQTVAMHLNAGAGQDVWRSPGNAYSTPVRLALDPSQDTTVSLTLDTVIPPIEPLQAGQVLQQGNPPDTDFVKFVKIKSEALSDFWGHPMYVGANVLLPEGYEEHPDVAYPVVYLQGHFPGRRAPFGFDNGRRARSEDFKTFWTSGDAPRMIVVTIRDANPFYDTSYSVNSSNVGPYGDAILNELMPYLEEHFRIIRAPWARVLAGGSTGGWEALALQTFYPETFGGAWGWCPDPVDFHDYQIVDVYDDGNAYVRTSENGWHEVERPNARRPDGTVVSTVRQENYMELATGTHGRSGGQWAIWEAVFGPVGPDGYPRPIWDKRTGAIDHETAAYWRDHFDLNHYLRQHWSTIGPALRGKLHVAVGNMDTYYLNNAVRLLEDSLRSMDDPPTDATFEYGEGEPHCWIGYSSERPGENLTYAEFVRVVADYLADRAPEGAELRWR